MTFGELLWDEAVHFASHPAKEGEVLSLTSDSRTAGAGSLFFCLPGAKCDGHDFAGDAYLRGCRHFVAERALPLPEDVSLLLCRNAKKTMARLASRYYGDPASELRIIGVTGTKGKTTTALMISDLLAAIGIPAGYIGSLGARVDGKHFNTRNTTPDSLALHWYFRQMLEAGVHTVVMEVSSQALSQHRVFGIPFDTAVLTNLSRDHIGAGEHRSINEYKRAKLSLFTDASPRLAVLNAGDRFARRVAAKTVAEQVVSFGEGRGSRYRAEGIRALREGNRLYTSFSVRLDGVCCSARLALAGAHYVEDFLAALATVSAVTDINPRALLPYAEGLRVPGRCETVPVQGSGLFVIDYAHNGASLAAALRGLRPYAKGRLLCLFGAVGGRVECRRRDMARAASRYADLSVITEDNPGREDPEKIVSEIYAAFPDKKKAVCIPDREAAIRYLLRVADPADIVLLAGKGDEQYQLKEDGKVPFSEVEILRRFAPSVRTK